MSKVLENILKKSASYDLQLKVGNGAVGKYQAIIEVMKTPQC